VITSTRNPKIQQLRSLQSRAKARKENGSFVIEGVRLAEEAVAANWPVTGGIYTETLGERGAQVVEKVLDGGTDIELVSPEVMAAASDTQSPQGLMLELVSQELAIPNEVEFVLIVDELRDPGNLGSLLRSAAAAAVDTVLLSPGCADAFAPKVLRGGMGAQFQLAIRKMDWKQIGSFCTKYSLQTFLTAADEGNSYHEADLSHALAFILGNEAHGGGAEARALATDIVKIDMPGKMESLNVAVAGSLILFEVLRQRRGANR
jgi:TrmH family RNA methyltransferase